MFKEQQQQQQQQLKRLNSDRPIIDHRIDILPSTNSSSPKRSLLTIQRLTQMPSNLTIERCCFLFIHLLFYVIILTIVFIRLEQFANKQEKFLVALRSNENLTFHQVFQNHPSETPLECSCHRFLHPKRNRSTRCLRLIFGINEILENVFCPNEESSQWLIIQNRESNTIDFNRSWFEYRRGFGHVHNQTDFWIGNENLHWLTTSYSCRLKIELTDWYNETRIATYENFRIADQKDGYRLHLSEYRGDIEPTNKVDSFSRWHQNARFSTWDHYATSTDCPQKHGGGGWWYHSGSHCAHVQLNGRHATHSDGLGPLNTGIMWLGWKPDRHYSFQRVNMAIQPKFRASQLSSRH